MKFLTGDMYASATKILTVSS